MNLNPLILAGLNSNDVVALQRKKPNVELWDSYRHRVAMLDGCSEDELIMAIYQLMYEQKAMMKWIPNDAITYSWVDAAMFLDERYPSYVDNFAEVFLKIFEGLPHYGCYDNEEDAIRINRIYRGIPLVSKDEVHQLLSYSNGQSIHNQGEQA